MRLITLQQLPNQSVSVTIDRERWGITIKQANKSMVVDLVLNDTPLIYGLRIIPNQPIIPYAYLSGAGNFMMLTNSDQLPDWQLFGVDQQLVYATADEINDAVAA